MDDTVDYAADMALAHSLADAADAITMAQFRDETLWIGVKPDATPVTAADLATERELRALLAARRPHDVVLGEEFGADHDAAAGSGRPDDSAGRRWVLDPIDGTKNFMRGVPIWATLIALLEDDEPVLGLVSAPALGRRWWAARGQGAYAGRTVAEGRRIRVSAVSGFAEASLCYSSLPSWADVGRLEEMITLLRAAWRTRAYGDFYGHMLVAEGAVDAMVEPDLALWDVAALVPIITEAGGMCTNRAGEPVRGPGAVLTSNGKVHEVLLAQLG